MEQCPRFFAQMFCFCFIKVLVVISKDAKIYEKYVKKKNCNQKLQAQFLSTCRYNMLTLKITKKCYRFLDLNLPQNRKNAAYILIFFLNLVKWSNYDT